MTLGGVPHLHVAMIEVQSAYMGYEGSRERIRALVGDNLDVVIGDVSSAGQFVEAGDLHFLAIGTQERMATLPDVPTLFELGADVERLVTCGIIRLAGYVQAYSELSACPTGARDDSRPHRRD